MLNTLNFIKRVFLCGLGGSLLYYSTLSSFAQTSPLEAVDVERTKTVAISTQGKAQVLILNPLSVGVHSVTDKSAELSGLQVGSSLVHIIDQAGRRTIKVEVTELLSIEKELVKRAENVRRESLGYPQRSLKFLYNAYHENSEQGIVLSLPRMREQDRIRTHEMQGSFSIPQGLVPADEFLVGDQTQFVGDGYLESFRNKALTKEVDQPRNLAFALRNLSPWGFGEMDVVGVDNYMTFSRFTVPGKRIRGIGIFPSESRLRIGKKGRLDPFFYDGQERDGGNTLDGRAGSQNRGPRNHIRGVKFDYYLWDTGKVYAIGTHRYGVKGAEFRSNNVLSTGFDWDIKKTLRLQGEFARNGPQSAVEFLSDLYLFKLLSVREHVWRVGKLYRSVVGNLGRQGQTGWENEVRLDLPFWEKAVWVGFKNSILRDRNAVNPDNIEEINTNYGLNTGIRLPFGFSLGGGYDYGDLSGGAFPHVTNGYNVFLGKEIQVNHPLLSRISFFGRDRRSEWDKSKFRPGFDAVLREVSLGGNATLWRGIGVNVTWSQAVLKEFEPEQQPGTIYPRDLTVGVGYSHSFQKIPVTAGVSFRYVNDRNTLQRTHLPFSDRDSMDGSGFFIFRLAEGKELFTNWSVRHSKRESAQVGQEGLVDVFLRAGFRTDWDTGFVLPRSLKVSGSVFVDANLNGIREIDEPGVEGVLVRMIDGPKSKTNNQGFYLIKGVKEGERVIQVDANEIPQGYFFTTPNSVPLFLMPGERVEVDFGIATQVEVRGRVFHDINENKVFDKDIDQPIEKVMMVIDTGQTAYTELSGFYSIKRVEPGSRTARVGIATLPSGYQTLAPVKKDFTSQPGDLIHFDIPLKAQRSLSGMVFEDLNGNGFQEKNEGGIKGIRVKMDSMETLTDEDGKYWFKALKPGRYTVELDPRSFPADYQITTADSMGVIVPVGPYVKEHLNFGLGPKKQSPLEKELLDKTEVKAIPSGNTEDS